MKVLGRSIYEPAIGGNGDQWYLSGMVDREEEARERLRRIIRWADTLEGKLRTHLDEWAAFDVGGELLTRTGRQRWFNNPCPCAEGARLVQYMDWHTPAAATILQRGIGQDPAVRKPKRGEPAPYRLIVDHAVPVRVIGVCVQEDRDLRRPQHLRDFLKHHFKRGVLTFAENQRLNDARLVKDMPQAWRPWGDPFARYVEVGLERANVGNF